jgi:uncharacterized protein (TIGR02466 family)
MTYEVMGLFPIPVYKSKIPAINQLTLTKLMNFDYEKSGYDDQTVTHKETANRYILDLPDMAGLKKIVQSKVNEYVHDVLAVSKEQSWDITTSWVNLAETGNYHTSHVHANALVGGVIYLKVDQKTGALCFHKNAEHKTLFTNTICVEFDSFNDWNTESIAVIPEEFDILIFPSTLAHSVFTNESTQNRFSLAFNVFPRGIVGQGGNSELKL